MGFLRDLGKFAGDTVGQIADGAWNTASGIIQDDKNKIDQGLNDMGDSVGRTAKGVYHTAKNTYYSGKSSYEVLRDGDELKFKQGLKDIGKTVAIGVLAVGVVDLVHGNDNGDPGSSNQNMADAGAEYNVHQVQTHVAQVNDVPTIDSDVTSDQPGTHHVTPHEVNGYYRSDDTYVEGDWRDRDCKYCG